MLGRAPLAGFVNKVTPRGNLIGYAGLAVLDTLAILAGKPKARRLTKPALMPVLAAAVSDPDPSPAQRRIGTALTLSAAGDTALLGSSRLAFLSGAGAFAGAHVNYLAAVHELGERPGMLSYRPWLAAPYALALAGFAAVLPKVARRTGWGEALAGLGYAGLLTAVGVATLDLRGRGGERNPGWDSSAARAAAGGALFVASDLLVGVRRYRQAGGADGGRADTLLDAGVMVSYTAAQALLALGLTDLSRQQKATPPA
ncbi:lysoplasmalogenase family protein [Longispora sp. NPDC051575]|uniref:lysoplasmalogenase family protein n=1 Tax=Longispora sp. NPDC051575 TaxID=3154943 RepID=UPI00341424C5